MMLIFDSVRAILSTDLVQTFERDLLSGSQVIAHTNTQKKAKTDAAKINTFRKTKFSGGKNAILEWGWINVILKVASEPQVKVGRTISEMAGVSIFKQEWIFTFVEAPWVSVLNNECWFV